MSKISVPLANSAGTIDFFADELPRDHNEILFALQSELAPLKIWRACAEFDALLSQIVEALKDKSVAEIYEGQNDFLEGITDIYLALAAKAMINLVNARKSTAHSTEQLSEYTKQIVHYLSQADSKIKVNDYTWLIKGFYEIIQGEFKRAEDHFRFVYDRSTKGQNLQRKKFYFGALIGYGLVNYGKQKYQPALDYFTKALMNNPAAPCSPSIRLAIACCCFKLEQYDRARMALDHAFNLEPENVQLLVMYSLLDLAVATKDKARRNESRHTAFEYAKLAQALDPTHPIPYVVLANHYFHNWRQTVFNNATGCRVIDKTHLLMVKSAAEAIQLNDQLRINRHNDRVHSVSKILDAAPFLDAHPALREGVSSAADFCVLELSERFSPLAPAVVDGSEAVAYVDTKEYGRVVSLAKEGLKRTSIGATKSELMYILGKVSHAKRNPENALEWYKRSLSESQDMLLSAFGAAQILLSRKEYSPALELFEKVLAKNPDDKDSQAYVTLVRGILKHQEAPFDKLREIAPGFQFEIDLWISQGQLWQRKPSEHATAQRCYMTAKECIEARRLPVPAAVLSNISVLHHSLGRLDKALEYSKSALASFRQGDANSRCDALNAVYKSSELEDIFYYWAAAPMCYVVPLEENSRHFKLVSAGEQPVSDLSQWLVVGDEIVVHGIKHTVEVVSATIIQCSSPISIGTLIAHHDHLQRIGLPHETFPESFSVLRKVSYNNFDDKTLSYCYNLARLLEDMGSSRAASDIYVELLKRHATFLECYLRLSLISCDAGKFEEASIWLSRALTVNENEPDANICRGDLFFRSGAMEDAKRCYEKICNKDRRDSRSMLALGNFFFSNGASKGGAMKDDLVKEGYKFYFHVLQKDPKNVFAANGMGMVLAEKNELDAAKEVFSKARETKIQSDDICTNLAHVYAKQNRLLDAERLYQATIQSVAKSCKSHTEKTGYLYECIAYVQSRHGRNDEAAKTLLRLIHLFPDSWKEWFNLAVVNELAALTVIGKKQTRSVQELQECTGYMTLAQTVLTCLLKTSKESAKSAPFDRSVAKRHLASCTEKLKTIEDLLQTAQIKENQRSEDRRRQEEEHYQRVKAKMDEQRALEMQREQEKREKQLLALQKESKLQELREKWIVAGGVPSSSKPADGKKKKGKRDSIALGDEDSDDSLDEVLGTKKPSVSVPKVTAKDIDFGSSDDEDFIPAAAAPAASSTLKLLKPKKEDDLFGDDDDDEDLFKADSTPSAAASAGVKRKISDDEDEALAVEVEVDSGAKKAKVDEADLFGDDDD